MATLKISSHARSISLPSSSHPLISNAEEHLERLKASEDVSSSSHLLACKNLNGLKNLYDCLDDVLQLPLSQQSLSNEDLLDGSLRLLDICGTIRDIYSQVKERVQALESSLRRKRNGDLVNEVNSYMITKKHLRKIISKCYKDLKKSEKKFNQDFEELPLVRLIKEIQEVGLTVLESTLSFLAPSKAGSFVSKLLHKKASPRGHSNIGAIEQIEVELDLLNKNKSNIDVVKGLEALESSIQELEEELESFFKLLLKTRVSILNILNH